VLLPPLAAALATTVSGTPNLAVRLYRKFLLHSKGRSRPARAAAVVTIAVAAAAIAVDAVTCSGDLRDLREAQRANKNLQAVTLLTKLGTVRARVLRLATTAVVR